MSGRPMRRSYDVPAPPPGRCTRAAAWLRRQDRAGRRAVLLAVAAVAGGVAVGGAVAVAGLLLQPRFTVLELAAQRLAPERAAAQPPGEEVAPFHAFDRRYVVRFAAPPGGIDAVVRRAARQRWLVVVRRSDTATLEREGVRGTVTGAGAQVVVRTQVAPWVRRARSLAWRLGAVAGAVVACGGLWLWLRRRSRLRAAPAQR